jgi:hypothetical protein
VIIGGKPVKEVDQAFFFAGNVPIYGQPVGADDIDILMYLRALRRIDVCGLLTGATLAKVGELVSVGTTLAFDECDAELKVSGLGRRFLAVTLETEPRDPPSFCQVAVPLTLSKLPGAPPQPAFLKLAVGVELVADTDCKLERRIGDGLAERLATEPLPPRDATAFYPARLAERDPCEVLSLLSDITAWDIPGSKPYRCRFAVNGNGLQVELQPRFIDDGPTACTAFTFVDPGMQRRARGGGYVSLGSVVIRPAVIVQDIDGNGCGAQLTDIAAAAGELFVS